MILNIDLPDSRKERFMRSLLVACCIVITIALNACEPTPTLATAPVHSAQLRALLEKGVAKGYPGIAFLIEDSKGNIDSAAAGYANLERKIPMEVGSGFHIASINKTFTAASTLHLVDEGKLSLNATLVEVLGDAVARIPNSERITVAQLLDHSSGIYATNNDMDYLNTLLGPKADPKRVWNPAELVALADKDRQKPFGEPGSGHYYSDTNYVLLGMMVTKVSGIPFKDFVKKTFFQPLQMDSTYFYTDYLAGDVKPRMEVTQGYMVATQDIQELIDINPMFKPVPGEKRGGDDLLNTTLAAERIDAAGGIVTTLDDLARFASALYRGKLLSAKSQAFLEAALEGADALSIDEHRTWTLQAMRKPYGVLIYKEGDGAGGVNTLMAYLPAKDEIFIGFTNSFGFFNEVDFMMDDVIGPWVADQ